MRDIECQLIFLVGTIEFSIGILSLNPSWPLPHHWYDILWVPTGLFFMYGAMKFSGDKDDQDR